MIIYIWREGERTFSLREQGTAKKIATIKFHDHLANAGREPVVIAHAMAKVYEG